MGRSVFISPHGHFLPATLLCKKSVGAYSDLHQVRHNSGSLCMFISLNKWKVKCLKAGQLWVVLKHQCWLFVFLDVNFLPEDLCTSAHAAPTSKLQKYITKIKQKPDLGLSYQNRTPSFLRTNESPVSFSQSFLMASAQVVFYPELMPLSLVLGAQLCFLILFAHQTESASGKKKIK